VPCRQRDDGAATACSTVAVDTYMESYHGKNYRLGFRQGSRVADCHTAHTVLPKDNPKSSVNPAICLAPAPSATPQFHAAGLTKFYSHGEMTDRVSYPILYWTFVSIPAC